jgi:hypothetical protein
MKEQMAIEDLTHNGILLGAGGPPVVQRTYGQEGVRLR